MIPVTFLKFSRDAEREADYLGLQYMYKAGYDPNSFVAFFEKVQADEKKSPERFPRFSPRIRPRPTASRRRRKKSRRFCRRATNTS